MAKVYLVTENQAELFKKYAIDEPEKTDPSHTVKSIGWSERDQKYYGWSHRVIVGFAIGDMIFEPDFGDDNTPFIKHGSVKIKNKADARKAAVAFSNAVS